MQDYWKWYATFLFFWDLIRSDAFLHLLRYFIVRSTTKNKLFMIMIWYSMTWYYPWGWVVIVVFLSTSYPSFVDKFSILFAYIFNNAYGHAHSLIYLEWLINLFILFLSYCLNSSIFIKHLSFIRLPICIMLVCIEIMSISLNVCKISCFNINEYICRL